MNGLLIKGGKTLFGTITPQGSKNAALPMIFASLLMHGTTVITGVPDITDVRVAIDIICHLGAKCTFSCGELYINTDELSYVHIDSSLTSKIRASSYLLGACLARFGRAHVSSFGGCNFEYRPIDMHLYAAARLGAVTKDNEIVCNRLFGADILFDKISVGATVNALLLSASAEGRSRIYSYAREPHVFSLIDFLRSAGAEILIFPEYIEVVGHPLSCGRAGVIPDMIEAGTYIAFGVATASKIALKCKPESELLPFVEALDSAGLSVDFDGEKMCVSGEMRHPCKIITSPYPGFPTDLQPQTAPLMALFAGGEITERVWLGRFGYLRSLSHFGVRYDTFGSRAIIYPSQLHSSVSESPDLRGGAALLVAALSAEGESVIRQSDIIHRGYENIVKKLQSIGADIKEIPLD